MALEIETLAIWAPALLLVAGRVVGMVLVAPVFSGPAVPVKVRLIVAAALALGAVGRLAGPVAPPASAGALALAAVGELAVGAAIGLAVRLIFVGVALGAAQAGGQIGLDLAGALGAGGSGGSVNRLFRLVAVVVFLAVGGLRALVGGLLSTFDVLPPAGFSPGDGLAEALAGALAGSFVLALRVAAPVLVAMLLATVALGLLYRAVPQCSVLSVGLPARVLVGLAALGAGLAALVPVMERAAGSLAGDLRAIVEALG